MKKLIASLTILCLLCGICLAGGSGAQPADTEPNSGFADSVVTIGAIDGMNAERVNLQNDLQGRM